MTPAQAVVMRIIRAGGLMVQYRRKNGRICYRLLSVERSPISNIQWRTTKALLSSERVIKAESGELVANPRKRISSLKNQA